MIYSMIDSETVRTVCSAIDDIAGEFRMSPGMLLTEDDLNCHLMAKLLRSDLGEPMQSADPNVMATAIHAEVPWFDEWNQLRLRPDITITDPRFLSIRHGMQDRPRLPHKGFHFIGDTVVVEFKFYRSHSGITARAVQAIRKDVTKIKTLRNRMLAQKPPKFFFGIVAVFAKYSQVCSEMDRFAETTNASGQLRLLVHTSGLQSRW